MANDPISGHYYEFGPFRLDTIQLALFRQGQLVYLPLKDMQTLMVLVESGGRIVEKAELLKKVWPETFIEEGNLAKHISNLRQVLGDDCNGSSYIETIPRRGYRFVAGVRKSNTDSLTVVSADVRAENAQATAEKSSRNSSKHLWAGKKIWLVAGGVLLLAIACYLEWRSQRSPDHSSAGMIMMAVLPFDNLTGDPNQDYFSDGLTEEMITQLGRMHPARLGVIARTSAMNYKHTHKSAAEIGNELHVDYLLEGSVRREGDRVRISAQLIRVHDQTHVWAENYEQQLRDILRVQDEVSQAVAHEIQITLDPQAEARYPQPKTVNPEAYEAYLKARFYNDLRSEAGLKKAVGYFQEALSHDRNFTAALAGLAYSYELLGAYGFRPPKEVLPMAKDAAFRAVQIDPSSVEGHVALGIAHLNFDWDLQETGREFEQALELDPNSVLAHLNMAYYLAASQRPAEAIRHAKTALHLDPVASTSNFDMAVIYYLTRQSEAAVQQCRETMQMHPEYGRCLQVISGALEAAGKPAEAFEEWLQFLRFSGESEFADLLAHTRDTAQKNEQIGKDLAKLILAHLKTKARRGFVPAIEFVVPYFDAGEHSMAMDLLERAAEERDPYLAYLQVDPAWDELRSEPRFQAVARRIGSARADQ